jgi:D-tyrosyl-tRNA(Tyr) deacylase
MRVLIQRIKRASISSDSGKFANIGMGLLLFVGVGRLDSVDHAAQLAKKISNLRIFEDRSGKMNLDIKQTKGEILSVPQFTLYADTSKGNRPGFDYAALPSNAKKIWKHFGDRLREEGVKVEEGFFGEGMSVELINDGPVTIWLDSHKAQAEE